MESNEMSRGWGCAFGCIWLTAVGSIAAIAASSANRTRQLAWVGGFVGAAGLAVALGVAHVLRTGEFSWIRGGRANPVRREDNPAGFWAFAMFLSAVTLALLGTAAWVVLHAHQLAAAYDAAPKGGMP
jgi:hypothetical protein